jgi:ABC-type phosphate/phosphonate transport system substrate-binding protein
MLDIATNIFGSYNKDEKRDYLRNVLHAEIKRELNDNFNSIEKENKKQINNYRFTKFLEILENPEKNIKEYVKRKNQESFNDLKITKKGMEEIREIARYDEKKDSSNVNVKEVISRAWEIFRNLEQTPKHQSDVDVFSAIDREKIKKGITKQDINNFLN